MRYHVNMNHQAYIEYLDRLPISEHTRRNYGLRVKKFLSWLDDTIDGNKALSSQVDRDFSVRDYQINLLQAGLKPSTINAHLAALDNFFQFIGLGATKAQTTGSSKTSSKGTGRR